MNLLRNPSFENGWYHPDGVPELQIPDEWGFLYAADNDAPNPHSDEAHNQFVRPEVRVLPKEQLPEHEQNTFVLDGNQTLKIFKGYGAWYAAMHQTTCLVASGMHKLTVPIFADLVKAYTDGQKVWADDPQGRDGLVRFITGGAAWNWQSLTPGELNSFTLDFHADGEIEIIIEIMCPFALCNSGIFTDAWSLTAIDTPDPPPDECWGQPRVQYRRVYHVVPQTTSQEDFLEIAGIAYDEGKQTVGCSSDDAGMGALLGKKSIEWNRAGDEAAYREFYRRNYPNAEVEFRYLGATPEPVSTATKTTLHLQAGVYGWPSYVERVKPAWAKGFWAEAGRDIKAVSPDTKYLWRHWFADYDQFRDDPDPEAAACRFLDAFWPAVIANPEIDAIEGQNETCNSGDPGTIERAARFSIALSNEVARRSVALGRHVALVALNPPIANIEAGQVPLLYDLVRTLNGNGHYFGGHTYCPVCLDFERSRHWLETEGYWWHLRPVLMWDARFRGAGITPPRYLFTEGGPCGTSIREDGRPGSMGPADGWRSELALNGNFDHYLTLQARYEEMLAEYPNVEACMLFTSGGGQKWASFELGGDELVRLAGDA